MPTKTRDLDVEGIQYRHLDDVTGSPGQDLSSVGRFKWVDSFTGTENPFWRQQVSKGANATTIATGTKGINSFPYGEASATYKVPITGGFQNRTSSVSGVIDLSPPRALVPDGMDVTAAEISARLGFIGKVREARSSFQGGVFLGELRETLKMIRHPAKALRRGIDDYYGAVKERSRRLSANARSRVAADTWLEYQYGWRPAVRDIEDAYKQLRSQPERYLKKISSRSDLTLTTVSSVSNLSVYSCSYRVKYSRMGKVSVRYLGAVSAVFHQAPTVLESWGLGTKDFVPTVYNLIPYSFLVDYFSNLGQVINGMSEGAVGLAWGCRTIRRTSQVQCDGATSTNTGSTLQSCHASAQGGIVSSRTKFERIPVVSVTSSVADFMFRLPGTSTKWLNITALAHMRR